MRKNRLLVFGCGEKARVVYKYIKKSKNRVIYFIDNDPHKVGGEYLGKKIIPVDDVVDLEYEYILIASIYWREMYRQLLELGVNADKIKCPLAAMKMDSFRKEYRKVFNLYGRIKFYYDKWYLAEQFHPDIMGIFMNPYYFSRKNIYDKVKKYAHYMSGRCLDFGCGTAPYKKLLPVEKYIGVEIETENRKPGVVYYDGYTLPFKSEVFDSIISSEVFEHVPNIEDILAELNRVLKPEGVMLLVVPFAYPKHCEPYDYRRYTMSGLKNLVQNAGFELIEGEVNSSFWECLAQFQNVYWTEEVNAKTQIGKMLKKIVIVGNTFLGIIFNAVLPYSEKMYLDNVVVMKKKQDVHKS